MVTSSPLAYESLPKGRKVCPQDMASWLCLAQGERGNGVVLWWRRTENDQMKSHLRVSDIRDLIFLNV